MRLRAVSFGTSWGAHAARVFATDPRTELVGLVARGSARSVHLAQELGVPLFVDAEAALVELRPQLASVAVHESLNVQLVTRLLEGDCHVLCSHPVAPAGFSARQLARAAEARRLVGATDYTLRLQPAFLALREALQRAGTVMRLSLESPASTSVIAVDLAMALCGAVARVRAFRQYPEELAARVSRQPRAFAPTFVLEHQRGCVTTITPVTHTDPATAFKLVVSAEQGRLEVGLPAGHVDWLAYAGHGRVLRSRLHTGTIESDPVKVYGEAMKHLTEHFISSCAGEKSVHASFDEEAAVSDVWNALRRSAHRGVDVAVEESRGELR
jgi:predicted dehydrogenase